MPNKVFLRDFLSRPGGAIWRIFWLHCHYPNKFPIYDQHVHRAMACIIGMKSLEIPKKNQDKVKATNKRISESDKAHARCIQRLHHYMRICDQILKLFPQLYVASDPRFFVASLQQWHRKPKRNRQNRFRKQRARMRKSKMKLLMSLMKVSVGGGGQAARKRRLKRRHRQRKGTQGGARKRRTRRKR